MASNWQRVKIDDVCDLIVDCVNKTAPKVEHPTAYKMLRTPNIRNGRVTTDDCKYVNEETFIKWTRRADVRVDDVLLTREAPLGEVGIVKSNEKLFLGQRLMQYRTDSSKLDPDFLIYSFLSPDLQHQFRMHEGSGSVVSHIRVGDCSKFELNLPPLHEQKEISHVLKTLDSKIELNRQTNQTLEQMAQALFKSWFVDFDPVFDNALASGMAINDFPEALQKKAAQRLQVQQQIANVEPSADQVCEAKPLPEAASESEQLRQLFPSEFEQSDESSIGINGWIPKGWSLGPFSKIAILKNKSVHPNKEPEKLWTQFSLPAFDAGQIPTHDLGIEIKSGKYKISENTVLVSKLNPHKPRIWMPRVKDTDVSVCSTEFMPFEPVNYGHRVFVFSLMNSENVKSKIASRVTGTTGSHQRVSPKEVAVMPILLPSLDCVTSFSNLIKSSFDKVELNLDQNIELAILRDTLLPKLISGELQLQK